MTRKESMYAAIRRQPIEHVPFATYNLHPYRGSSHSQDPGYAGLLDLVREVAGVYFKAGIRTIGNYNPALAALTEESEDIQDGNRIHTTVLHTPKGDLRAVRMTPPDQPSMLTKHFIECDEDIDRYLSLPWDPPEYDRASAEALLDELGGHGVMTVDYADPMHKAVVLFDFLDFCMRCRTDMRPLKRMIDHFYEQIAEDTRRKAKATEGLDVIFLTGGPEVATPPMMAPELFGELVMPYQKKLIEIIHEHGHVAMIHCHGKVRRVLDYMIQTDVDCIEPIEPPPQGDITLEELLARGADHLAFMGHIQDQEFHTVPPGTMTKRVEDIARVIGSQTGYIMTPTCTPFQHPPTDTFVRNYTEWLQAATRIFGPSVLE